MAKKSDRQTSREWLEAFLADPEVQERTREIAKRAADRPARLARERELQAPILQELAEIGVNIRWISDFDPCDLALQGTFNIPPRIVPQVTAEVARILLKWLPRFRDNDLDDLTQLGIIQGLRYAREPYDGRPLVDCYLADSRGRLRDRISELFSVTQPTGISDWLVDVVGNRRYTKDCSLLLVALAHLVPRAAALPILRQELKFVPGLAAMALAEVGGPSEADFLEAFLCEPYDWESRDLERWCHKKIEQAIRKIRKRAERDAKQLANPKNKKRSRHEKAATKSLEK